MIYNNSLFFTAPSIQSCTMLCPPSSEEHSSGRCSVTGAWRGRWVVPSPPPASPTWPTPDSAPCPCYSPSTCSTQTLCSLIGPAPPPSSVVMEVLQHLSETTGKCSVFNFLPSCSSWVGLVQCIFIRIWRPLTLLSHISTSFYYEV